MAHCPHEDGGGKDTNDEIGEDEGIDHHDEVGSSAEMRMAYTRHAAALSAPMKHAVRVTGTVRVGKKYPTTEAPNRILDRSEKYWESRVSWLFVNRLMVPV
jgi:hypothetical protein